MFSLQKKKRNEERKYPSFKHIHNSPILPSFVPTRNIAFFEAIFFRPISLSPPPPRFHHFQRGMRNIHEKTWARFFGISRGSESRIALRHSPLFHRAGIRSMCYVIGIAGGGKGGAQKGRNILWAAAPESLIRIYQKDWLLHCGPRSASVLLAIAIRNAFPWLRILTFRGMQRPGHNAPANLSDSS